MRVLYVLIGNRDLSILKASIISVRKYIDAQITVYSDIEVNLPVEKIIKIDRIKYDKREENRNSSLYRLKALLDYEECLYLDNDIIVVSSKINQGKEIAKRFGISLVANPRGYIGKEIRVGVDVSEYDKKIGLPDCMMAMNAGLMFYHNKSRFFIETWYNEQLAHPSRGQMSLLRAIDKTNIHPYVLPFNWLVCREHVGIENPITLHVGHPEVRRWLRKF